MKYEVFTAQQAAEQLNVDVTTITRSCSRHQIGRKHARSWLIEQADLAKLREVVREKSGNPNWVKKDEK